MKNEIDLGLAILRSAAPTVAMNCAEIACFCGCSAGIISRIEKLAMRKLRGQLRGHPEILAELKLRL